MIVPLPTLLLDVLQREGGELAGVFGAMFRRNPAARIRDPKDVFNLDSARLADQGPEGQKKAQEYIHNWKVLPPQSCSGCHR